MGCGLGRPLARVLVLVCLVGALEPDAVMIGERRRRGVQGCAAPAGWGPSQRPKKSMRGGAPVVVRCDGCPRVFHLACLGLASLPDSEYWFGECCPHGNPTPEARKQQQQALRTREANARAAEAAAEGRAFPTHDGLLVWAKQSGFQFWPAKVANPPPTEAAAVRAGHIYVKFFGYGGTTGAWIKANGDNLRLWRCSTFDQLSSKKLNKGALQAEYEIAVRDALEAEREALAGEG